MHSDPLWKRRYRAGSLLWADLAARHPARGLVCSDHSGKSQLYAWDVEGDILAQRTDQKIGVGAGMLSSDGRYILFHKDQDGQEIGHYVCMPYEGGDLESITPDLPPYSSFGLVQSSNADLIGFTGATPSGFTTYALKIGQAPHLIYHSEQLCLGTALSSDGELVAIGSTDRSATSSRNLLVFKADGGQRIAELWDGESTDIGTNMIEIGAFSPAPGDRRLATATNRSGFVRPVLWDPLSNERQDIDLAGIDGDIIPHAWTPDGKRLVLRQQWQAQYRLHLYDTHDGSLVALDHPPGVVYSTLFAPDGSILTVWQDPAPPPRLIALDEQSGRQSRVVLNVSDALPGRPWESITFPGANEDVVQAWLARPEGSEPVPVVMHMHGGPTTEQTAAFFPEGQSWVDHGFAFVSVNFHGSTTFGRDFEQSIQGKLGDLEVIDLAAAHEWLVNNGIARPDAVFLSGASYGGYLTLLAMGKYPELWAGGLAQIAIADWSLMYEDMAESFRGFQRAFFGGTPDEVPEATRASSPITYAENLQAPVLVIQGRNDSRCPARQMEAYETRLKQLNKTIRVQWYDAGHQDPSTEEAIVFQAMNLEFACSLAGMQVQA